MGAFAPSGFFVIRTPLLPIDAFEAWTSRLAAPLADDDALEGALDADATLLTERLRSIVQDRAVREAIFLASPSLDEAVTAFLGDPSCPRARGALVILVRYFARMASRPTPFGLFSGCAVGELAAATHLRVAGRSGLRRHTRLDMHYLTALTERLEDDVALRRRLRYRPSSALFPSAGQLRYVEARVEPATRARTFHLVSVEQTEYLQTTLERAAAGATTDTLAQALVGEDVTAEDAFAFIDELVRAQILVSELAPAVTGPPPLDALVATLAARVPGAPAAEVLGRVATAVGAIDGEGVGLSPDRFRAVAAELSSLPVAADLARLFQVDLYKAAPGATLGRAVVSAIERGLAVLTAITPAREHPDLRRFREAFVERYEGREVPLALALDVERGIGFGASGGGDPSPLLEGIRFPLPPGAASREPDGAGDFLLGRAGAIARSGALEWHLTDADVAAMTAKEPASLPVAFAVLAQVAAESAEALARGAFTVRFGGAIGPSGANLLGRFCLGEPHLEEKVREHLRAEEAADPHRLYAEVVHLPEGRLGNILCRPVLRAWEIPYLGRSGAPEDGHIPVTDLRVSVRGQRVVLRSERLDREVVPRLTSAHNYEGAQLALYRFLCLVGHGHGLPRWSWGAAKQLGFLPRVVRGNAVFAVARWRLDGEGARALDGERAADRFRRVRALRERLRLPRLVHLADGDNVLLVDLENVLSVDSFVALVKGRDDVVLEEVWPPPGQEVATCDEGRLVHELVVPFVRTAAVDHRSALIRSSDAPRTFTPGSSFLYVKLYGGTATADGVLTDVIAPLAATATASGAVESWFFVRYGDPHPHLRVRFRGDEARLFGEVLPALHRAVAPCMADGRLWKVQLDTYEREVERYGGDEGILHAEEIFRADSDAVLSMVPRLSGDDGAHARWRLALYGMHALLSDGAYGRAERISLLAAVRASFAAEHRADGDLERRMGAKFRKERSTLAALLAGDAAELSWAQGVFHARSAASGPSWSGLLAAPEVAASAARRDGVMASVLHMHANRVFRSEARAQELLVYDFLLRLYESEEAREKTGRRNG